MRGIRAADTALPLGCRADGRAIAAAGFLLRGLAVDLHKLRVIHGTGEGSING